MSASVRGRAPRRSEARARGGCSGPCSSSRAFARSAIACGRALRARGERLEKPRQPRLERVVLAHVVEQRLAREGPRRPRLVKRVLEQVPFGDARVNRCDGDHRGVLVREGGLKWACREGGGDIPIFHSSCEPPIRGTWRGWINPSSRRARGCRRPLTLVLALGTCSCDKIKAMVGGGADGGASANAEGGAAPAGGDTLALLDGFEGEIDVTGKGDKPTDKPLSRRAPHQGRQDPRGHPRGAGEVPRRAARGEREGLRRLRFGREEDLRRSRLEQAGHRGRSQQDRRADEGIHPAAAPRPEHGNAAPKEAASEGDQDGQVRHRRRLQVRELGRRQRPPRGRRSASRRRGSRG